MHNYKLPKLKATPRTIEYHFDLVGEIEFYDEYLELLDALREAQEDDTVHIHINTPGGDLAIVAQILHNIEECKGTVVTHAEGEVKSGGSLIFFKGDQLHVGEFSEFLAHGPHGGFGGKLADNVEASKHTTEYVRKLYTDVYADFYSPREIRAILKGKELYETSQQVNERLTVAMEKMHAEFKKEMEETFGNN